MKKLIYKLMSVAAVIGIVGAMSASPTLAVDPLESACKKTPNAEICLQKSTAGANVSTSIENIIKLLLWALGVICVIVIIIAGIQYAVAAGDSNQITKAKNTILYAIVGLVVALLSYAIVNFVVDQFKPAPPPAAAETTEKAAATAPTTNGATR